MAADDGLGLVRLELTDEDGMDELLLEGEQCSGCLLYTSPSPRDQRGSRMPSSA